MAVEFTRSENSTVRCRRSPDDSGRPAMLPEAGAGVGSSAVIGSAHWPQNLNPAGFSAPHFGQACARGAAHWPQNFIRSGFPEPHDLQSILVARNGRAG